MDAAAAVDAEGSCPGDSRAMIAAMEKSVARGPVVAVDGGGGLTASSCIMSTSRSTDNSIGMESVVAAAHRSREHVLAGEPRAGPRARDDAGFPVVVVGARCAGGGGLVAAINCAGTPVVRSRWTQQKGTLG